MSGGLFVVDAATGAAVPADRCSVVWASGPEAAAVQRTGVPLPRPYLGLDGHDIAAWLADRGLLDGFGPDGPSAAELDEIGGLAVDDGRLWSGYAAALADAADEVRARRGERGGGLAEHGPIDGRDR